MSDEDKKNGNIEEDQEITMSPDEFKESVKEKLTGDPETDSLVLAALFKSVRDDLPEFKEAIWDLFYENLPEEQKMFVSPDGTLRDSVVQHIGSDYIKVPENVANHNPETPAEVALDAVLKSQELLEKGRRFEAFVETISAIMHLNDEGIIKESLEKNERNFNHPIEREYIRLMEPDDRPEGEVQLARLFNRSGFLMHELGHVEEAVDELKKSLLWDPSDFGTLLELANTYKALNEPSLTFCYAEQALNYAFEPKQMSAAWRSMGFALIEMGLYAEAAACFYEALRYEPESEIAKSELDYISYKAGLGIPEKDMNSTIEMANELEVDLKKPFKMYQFLEKVAEESEDENLRDYASQISKELKPMVDSLIKDIDNSSVELKEVETEE